MKLETDFTSITKPLQAFFRRFHTILFFLMVSGGLFIAILMLLKIIYLPSDTTGTSDQAINGTFDQETMERIENGSRAPSRPASRSNPFVE